MIKNDKFFVAPPGQDGTIKEILRFAIANGAGRAVDRDGISPGPWSPDQLTDAISEIDKNSVGVDLRTVQLWFQENDKGISADNIRWLARIFGCGETNATSEWQTALAAGQQRLNAKRRQRRRRAAPSDEYATTEQLDIEVAKDPTPSAGGGLYQEKDERDGFNLAKRSEALFNARNSLNLPIAVWTTCGILWFSTYILGVHSVTYSPASGLDKQVGFYWSISWTIGEMALLPVFLILVSDLISFWKNEGRSSLCVSGCNEVDESGWLRRVENFSFSYWAILLICFFGIFLLQWAGVYLKPLLEGQPGKAMVDWILVTLVKPEIATKIEMISVSFFAFFYSGLIYWFFFVGLLLLYKITSDFRQVYEDQKNRSSERLDEMATKVSMRIMHGLFRCTVLGVMLATSIKLNAAYLVSDGQNILIWLVQDALIFIGTGIDRWSWLSQSPSPFFTSFLLLFITTFVFFLCSVQIYHVLEGSSRRSKDCKRKCIKNTSDMVMPAMVMWNRMLAVVVLLAANYFAIGVFYGFSFLLAACVVLAIYSFFWRDKFVDVS
ncbi:RcgA family putative transporter [Tritonibacter scottomollicae]|uniref:Transmembrane protein n=1 Tax=Tritonibacter scottomollicae TaxID=483013 RepID=A0A2T1AAF2_TRISK|nr:hypothetical protein [Tritonibacter scottomollicae]PRZ45576.1 hypothetical protein CLV89_11427 [Tritonibacter scottomollicae]